MPAWLCILVAALIVLWACSPALALLISGSIKLADSHETPPVRAGGEDPAHRRAHLRLVREVSS